MCTNKYMEAQRGQVSERKTPGRQSNTTGVLVLFPATSAAAQLGFLSEYGRGKGTI